MTINRMLLLLLVAALLAFALIASVSPDLAMAARHKAF